MQHSNCALAYWPNGRQVCANKYYQPTTPSLYCVLSINSCSFSSLLTGSFLILFTGFGSGFLLHNKCVKPPTLSRNDVIFMLIN